MFGVILGVHILVCVGLIVVVLLQSGKGGGLAGAFGGAGGVGAVFGGQAAATFLTKATRYLAIAFMLTSLTLAFTLRATMGGGAITEGLQQRGAAPATTAGETVPTEGAPSELPGDGSEGSSGGAAPEAGDATQGAASSEMPESENPVATEGQ
jgi:preprotein translocase subunit SecG